MLIYAGAGYLIDDEDNNNYDNLQELELLPPLFTYQDQLLRQQFRRLRLEIERSFQQWRIVR